MAWQVAVVLDESSDPSMLLGQMPVWARSTAERAASAEKAREDWDGLWHPEPALTLVDFPIGSDPTEALLDSMPTVEMHHASMVCLRIIGVPRSERLTEAMSSYGYLPIAQSTESGMSFARPISSMIDVPELDLDAEGWQNANDVYDAFFRAVRAPSWHGRNFNALNDSISTGGISEVEVPYRLVVRNTSRANAAARETLENFRRLILDIQATGCPVSIVLSE